MKEKLFIQPLNDIQQQDWLALWQAYQAFYQTCLTDEINQLTWQRLTDPNVTDMSGFAAVLDGKVMGLVHVIEHASCWTAKPYLYLQDLFTLEEYRGQGIARALIQQVKHYADAHGCDRVYWLTHQDNIQAQKLYDQVAKKTGFIQYRMA